MPNAKEHIVFAAGIGFAGYALYCACFDRQFKFGEALLATGSCVLGSLGPDGFEPALHPCHRSVAHSVAAGAASLHTFVNTDWVTKADPGMNFVLAFVALGYLSHLLLDGQTPKGLPLLC